MKTYGLIGYRLSHSFSKKYFTEKFRNEGIEGCEYDNFQIDCIEEFSSLLKSTPDFRGFNVTIPYKEQIIPYLDRLDPAAKEIGAVNVIKMEEDGTMIGYNSDYYGFKDSLYTFISQDVHHTALVLGTGGAAKAVVTALKHLGIPYQYVSRISSPGILSYEQLNKEIIEQHKIIINTSPLGMYPNVETFPNIPYLFLTAQHYLYDLVYNPEETVFMKKGRDQGAHVLNGLPMLIGQAEKAWQIWNEK
ncbi:MAG: shikimate dehydrogenase [Cytophagales bacterium]|nr:shikimate dehydrogenase [Cytophaga sp.]